MGVQSVIFEIIHDRDAWMSFFASDFDFPTAEIQSAIVKRIFPSLRKPVSTRLIRLYDG